MNLKNLLTARKIRRLNRNLTVKTARTQQGRIQNIRTVRRSNQDDVGVRIETIHLNQQLVQRLLTLVVTATDAGATLAAHRIDLINKNDRRRRILSLLKQVAHAGRTHTNEHLNEIGTRNREERNARFASNSLRNQRLTGTRRAVQQNTTRNLRANRRELLRILQELLNLAELLNSLIHASHVLKRDLRHVLIDHLRPGLTELHDLAGTTLGTRHQEQEQAEDDDHRQQQTQRGQQPVARLRTVLKALFRLRRRDRLSNLFTARHRIRERDLLTQVTALMLNRIRRGEFNPVTVVVEFNAGNLLVLKELQTNRRRNLVTLPAQQNGHTNHEPNDTQNDPEIPGLIQLLLRLSRLVH